MATLKKEWQPAALQQVQVRDPKQREKQKPASWQDVVDANWNPAPDAAVGRTGTTQFFNQTSSPVPVIPNTLEVIGSSMFGIGRSIWNRIDAMNQGFEADPNYKLSAQDMDKISTQIQLDSERMQKLNASTSAAMTEWLVRQYADADMRHETQSYRPWTAMAASIVDVDLGLGVLAKPFTAARIGSNLTRLQKGIIGAGAIATANAAFDSATSQYDTRSTTERLLDGLTLTGAGAFLGATGKSKLLTQNGEKLAEGTIEHVTQKAVKIEQEAASDLSKGVAKANPEKAVPARSTGFPEGKVTGFQKFSQRAEQIAQEARLEKQTQINSIREAESVVSDILQGSSHADASLRVTRRIDEIQAILPRLDALPNLNAVSGSDALLAGLQKAQSRTVGWKAAFDQKALRFQEAAAPMLQKLPQELQEQVQKALAAGAYTADLGKHITKALPEADRAGFKELNSKVLREQRDYRYYVNKQNKELQSAQRVQSYNPQQLTPVQRDALRNELQQELTDLKAQQFALERNSDYLKDLRKVHTDNVKAAKAAKSKEGLKSDTGIPTALRRVPEEQQAAYRTSLEETEKVSGEQAEKLVLEIETSTGTEHIPLPDRPAPVGEAAAIRRAAEYSSSAKQYMSTTDKLAYYGQNLPDVEWEQLNRLFADPAFNNPDNAITHAALLSRHGEWRLNALDDALGKAAQEYYGASGRFNGAVNPTVQPKHITALRAAQKDLSDLRLQLYQMERQAAATGTELDLPALIQKLAPNKGIADAMQTFVDSGFSKFYAQQLKKNGLLPEDFAEGLGTYMPLQWSYAAMRKAFDAGLPEEVLARFIGEDVLERFPDLAKYGRDADSIGKKFIQTQKTSMQATEHMPVGATRDFIADILLNQGVEANRIDAIVDSIMHKQTQKGHKNLRTRNSWDFNRQLVHNGQVYSLKDFVDTDVMTQLQSYNRQMAHRNGLAHYGMSPAELDNLFVKIQDNLPAGVNPTEARDFLKAARQQLLGQAVGEQVPTLLRSATTVASSMVLQNAGISAFGDISTAFQRLGFLRTAKYMLKQLPSLFYAISKYTPEEAMRLKDVLVGTSTAHERIKYFVTHFEDNHAIPIQGVHGYIARAGQSIMHLNTSEAVRRWLVNATVSTYEDAIIEAAKGSKTHRELLMRTGATERDFQNIMQEYGKHGLQIQKWDADISLRTQQLLMNASDDIALTAKVGEAPAFLEQTTTGKILFPFMRFAMAGHQKILRKTYNQDGIFGVAVLLMYNGMLAPVLAAAKNVTNGKRWDEDIFAGSVQQAPALGYFGIALDSILNSQNSKGAAVFSPLSKMNQLFRKVGNPDHEMQVYDYTDATPLLGLTVGNQAFGLLKLLNEEDDD
jgi:hypothetical protein